MKPAVLASIMVLITGGAFSEIRSETIYSDDFARDFGNFRVGFNINDLIDESRTYDYTQLGKTIDESGQEGRPVRIYTWYPAVEEAELRQTTLGRYIEIAGGDFHGSDPSDTIPDKLPIERALSDEQLSALMILTTNSYENARAAEGRFPLIIFGQGLYYENPVTHFALCEYLASHGFVVASCPLMGTDSPLVRLTVKDLESIVRDLEFVLEFSLNQSSVDERRIGIIGFDMGGMAAQVLQMRNSGIDAIMTMDAGIIFTHYSGLPGNHPSFDLWRMTSPWLHMTQKTFIEQYREQLDQSVWGTVSAERYLALFKGVRHVNFTSYGLLNIPASLVSYWGENTLPNIPIYRSVCSLGLSFMNAYLKDSQKDLKRLIDEANNQHPDRVYTLENIKGITPGLTFDQFLNEIIAGDFEQAISQIKQYKEDNPTWKFYPEDAVNDIGYRFLYSINRPQIALEIFKLNVEMNPQSGNVYDSYAEALVVLGRIEEAVENYKKSLELDPENRNAKKMIDELNNRQSD